MAGAVFSDRHPVHRDGRLGEGVADVPRHRHQVVKAGAEEEFQIGAAAGGVFEAAQRRVGGGILPGGIDCEVDERVGFRRQVKRLFQLGHPAAEGGAVTAHRRVVGNGVGHAGEGDAAGDGGTGHPVASVVGADFFPGEDRFPVLVHLVPEAPGQQFFRRDTGEAGDRFGHRFPLGFRQGAALKERL